MSASAHSDVYRQTSACSACGATRVEDVVEPLYDLRIARHLIPYATMHALYQALHRHKNVIPTRYRQDESGRLHRLITADEIKFLRDHALVNRRKRSERT